MTITYKCKNEDCGEEFEISVSPVIPAKIYGPPEHCHPAEGGEYEPSECPECGQEADEDTVLELAQNEIDSAREDAAERRAEAIQEQWEEDLQEREKPAQAWPSQW